LLKVSEKSNGAHSTAPVHSAPFLLLPLQIKAAPVQRRLARVVATLVFAITLVGIITGKCA
jgi:hypothetical protein